MLWKISKKRKWLFETYTADENLPTTNPNIESHKQQEEEGYKIAIEDTMIGYNGKPESMDVELDNPNLTTPNSRGVDDND